MKTMGISKLNGLVLNLWFDNDGFQCKGCKAKKWIWNFSGWKVQQDSVAPNYNAYKYLFWHTPLKRAKLDTPRVVDYPNNF